MRTVRLPTVRHLMIASLETLRATIKRTGAERDPERWAACHVILGCALRLQSQRMRAHMRASMLVEAVRAFDTALAVYCKSSPFPAHTPARLCQEPGKPPLEPCTAEHDGMQLIAEVVADPIGASNDTLERAVLKFRESRAQCEDDTTSWNWIASTNNLACALTLLGNRVPASTGITLLHEAVEILQEALKVRSEPWRRQDSASTHVNLAEALLAISERAIPAERLRYLEQAVTAAANALLIVAPAEYAWLIELEQGGLA
jgi:hypothetical protein